MVENWQTNLAVKYNVNSLSGLPCNQRTQCKGGWRTYTWELEGRRRQWGKKTGISLQLLAQPMSSEVLLFNFLQNSKSFFTWTILNDSQREFAALFPKIPYKSVLASYRSIYECSREDCKMAWIHNLIKLHVHYILNRILKKATKTSWTCNIFPSISL